MYFRKFSFFPGLVYNIVRSGVLHLWKVGVLPLPKLLVMNPRFQFFHSRKQTITIYEWRIYWRNFAECLYEEFKHRICCFWPPTQKATYFWERLLTVSSFFIASQKEQQFVWARECANRGLRRFVRWKINLPGFHLLLIAYWICGRLPTLNQQNDFVAFYWSFLWLYYIL